MNLKSINIPSLSSTSFVSRGLFVDASTACETVSALLRWCFGYLETCRSKQNRPSTPPRSPMAVSPRRDLRDGRSNEHNLFYTIAQSIFYIMCFRGPEVIRKFRSPDPNAEEVDFIPDRWAELCCNKLKPLKFCLESVRNEFLHLSGVFKLLTKDEIQTIEDALEEGLLAKKRQMIKKTMIRRPVSPVPRTMEAKRRKGGVGGLGKGSNPLDSFFPFDPYLLRRSYSFIEEHYRHWDGSSVEENSPPLVDEEEKGEGSAHEEDSETDSEGEEDDDSDDDSRSSDGASLSDDGASASNMCVSYGEKAGAWMQNIQKHFNDYGGEEVFEEKEDSMEDLSSYRRNNRVDSVASEGDAGW